MKNGVLVNVVVVNLLGYTEIVKVIKTNIVIDIWSDLETETKNCE